MSDEPQFVPWYVDEPEDWDAERFIAAMAKAAHIPLAMATGWFAPPGLAPKPKDAIKCPHCDRAVERLLSSPTHDWVCSRCYSDSVMVGKPIALDERKGDR